MNFKEALIAHLQGEKVWVKSASTTHRGMPSAVEEWREFELYYYGLKMEELIHLASLPSNNKSFRLAPRTVMIGDVECEAPLSECSGTTKVFTLNRLGNVCEALFVEGEIWSVRALAQGRLFATEEACEAAHDAWVKLMTGSEQ